MQVANGNFGARVPLDHNNVLWSIAGSLNNLLARLQGWRQDALRLQRTEMAIQQVLQDIQLAKKRGEPLKAYRTGTALDPLIAELATQKNAHQPLDKPSNSRLATEKNVHQFLDTPSNSSPTHSSLDLRRG
jgi:hypothetical protein